MTMKRQLFFLFIGAAFILLLISVSSFVYLKYKHHSLSKSNFQTLDQFIQQVPQEKLDKAIAVLKEELRKNPNYSEAHVALGILYHKKELLDEALSELKTALTMKPDFINIYQEMYLIYKEKGMEEEASRALASYEKLKEDK
ncbi:hypothetical protein BIY37_11305 [Candidatus Brocadia sapporoensis]|uniref:Uncharacterized protein n=2 Tax=Candidatus Brocadia sapporoensis TaxID=392547 RepID=A0A1V6LXN2_9BACT|nr:tetratricopeptide repeat protein [Candidatus Brocadia sp.]OQD44900.1 hypothetical protein BIY37_11305 [Candidatus Brocadia sapporoensis]TVL94990.1 MAG: hypothetical protein CV082_12715 [Candidatus Brocadia sp. BL1]GJQ23618.1 MAG: hypothetical protein HBSAPP01_14080 [Candidatus Brocadia sapporoensis]